MSLTDRLQQLEREQNELRRRLDGQLGRQQPRDLRPTSRLIVTSNPPSGTYPQPEDNPTTYPFRFVDVGYNAVPGSPSSTLAYRQSQAVAGAVVKNLGSSYIPVGTVVSAEHHGVNWFCNYVDPASGAVVFTTTATLADGGTASATIKQWNGTAYISGGTITVHDVGTLGATVPSGSWGVAQLINNRYEVVQIKRSPAEDPGQIHWALATLYLQELKQSTGSVQARIQAALTGSLPAGVSVGDDEDALNLRNYADVGATSWLHYGAVGDSVLLRYDTEADPPVYKIMAVLPVRRNPFLFLGEVYTADFGVTDSTVSNLKYKSAVFGDAPDAFVVGNYFTAANLPSASVSGEYLHSGKVGQTVLCLYDWAANSYKILSVLPISVGGTAVASGELTTTLSTANSTASVKVLQYHEGSASLTGAAVNATVTATNTRNVFSGASLQKCLLGWNATPGNWYLIWVEC